VKTLFNVFILSLFVGLVPRAAFGKENLFEKFYVSSVKGRVECISEDRIFDLRKGDVVLARGSSLRSFAGGSATIVFSNETAFFVDEKSQFKINKFEQQPFLPNNNLVIEPSNSDTFVTVSAGRIVINTPQLLSGTSLVFETAHAHVLILNGQPGGEKAFIEVTDKQTHFALITGAASVQVRGSDGNFLSIGTRLKSNEQAYVRYTLTGQITMSETSEVALSPAGGPAKPGAAAGSAPGKGAPAPGSAAASGASTAQAGSRGAAQPFSPNSQMVTVPGEAVVLRVTGEAKAQSTAKSDALEVANGAHLHQGAIIETGPEGEVYLQAYEGAVADIKPNSRVVIEKLATALAGGVIQKQTALLDLRRGTIVSVIDPDPAKRLLHNFGVRTPKGIATAHGTSFSVSVSEDNFSVAATADTVSFVEPSGTSYMITAGNITITPPGGQPQPPVPLATAVAADPAIAGVVRTAVNTVSSVVQNNIGSLPSASAINLISQVVGVASAAMPSQAASFTTEVVNAVNFPGASTAGSAGTATASVTSASVAAAPAQASQVAGAATSAAPAQANTIAAAAASAAPAQATGLATTVLAAALAKAGSQPSMTDLTQQASSLAAAVATAVPAQAGPVAGALMQAISQANPQATGAATTQAGATLASAVTSSVPSQAAPVAAAVMQSMTQSTPSLASAANISQTASTLAAAVTTTAPTQAVPVATALMQFVTQTTPAASTSASGLIAATVTAASNTSAATVSASAASSSSGATAAQAGSSATVAVQAATTQSITDIVTTTTGPAAAGGSSSGTGVVQRTSIIVTKLAGGEIVDTANNLGSASSTVSWSSSTSTDSGGSTPTVTATPTAPVILPTDTTISNSAIGGT
jgi:FecR protein